MLYGIIPGETHNKHLLIPDRKGINNGWNWEHHQRPTQCTDDFYWGYLQEYGWKELLIGAEMTQRQPHYQKPIPDKSRYPDAHCLASRQLNLSSWQLCFSERVWGVLTAELGEPSLVSFRNFLSFKRASFRAGRSVSIGRKLLPAQQSRLISLAQQKQPKILSVINCLYLSQRGY